MPHGTVVDFYEVYSVHQYGMAPAFLRFAERLGVPEARDALTKGFRWVFGENQMHRSMLIPATGLAFDRKFDPARCGQKSFGSGERYLMQFLVVHQVWPTQQVFNSGLNAEVTN